MRLYFFVYTTNLFKDCSGEQESPLMLLTSPPRQHLLPRFSLSLVRLSAEEKWLLGIIRQARPGRWQSFSLSFLLEFWLTLRLLSYSRSVVVCSLLKS